MKKEKINIDFGGIIPVSTIDWYGKSSCVVFLNKCPFRCPHCQNHKLLENTNLIDIKILKKKILESKKFISAVVFSGGEPTIQADALEELGYYCRKQGLLIGLQTNGYYPDVLRRLVNRSLVDGVFLDIKADPLDSDNYNKAIGIDKDIDANKNLIKSLKILESSYDLGVFTEVRTTVFRSNMEDIYKIAKFLEDNDYLYFYIIQQGIPRNALDEKIRKEKILENDEIKRLINDISKNVNIKIKFRAKCSQ